MRRFLSWLNERTGYTRLTAPIRQRMLPDGPSWLLATAPVLMWLVAIEIVTGLLLMTTYSPSINNAWASVHYIEQSPGGTFIRGLHHYCAQAILIVFIVHIARVILSAAFRAPRELIWVTGLLLLPVMILWKVSGNPLSGSLDGMSQIEVEGAIIGSTPIVGPVARQILIGGEKVGHLTLTHLYFLHVGLMPLIALVLLGLHITQIYRHGLSNQDHAPHPERACTYVPFQSWRNMALLAVVVGVIGYISWRQGVELGPPADSDLPNSPRPVWYFLWLFELRRYFTGPWEFVATIIIPGVLLGYLLLLPLIDKALSVNASRAMRFIVVFFGLGGCALLTYMSLHRDTTDEHHQTAVAQGKLFGERARTIAVLRDIPAEGADQLLKRDGMMLFYKHCLACHSYADTNGHGLIATKSTAPNLYGVGTRDWVAGWLDPDRIKSDQYFGGTKFKAGDMVDKVKEYHAAAKKDSEKGAKIREKLDLVIAALSAEAKLPAQKDLDATDAKKIKDGKSAMAGDLLSCTSCHKFHDEEGDEAPDLTGYASAEWLTGIIANPAHERFYKDKKNDRMPAFAADAKDPKKNLLTPAEISALVKFLRNEDLVEDP